MESVEGGQLKVTNDDYVGLTNIKDVHNEELSPESTATQNSIKLIGNSKTSLDCEFSSPEQVVDKLILMNGVSNPSHCNTQSGNEITPISSLDYNPSTEGNENVMESEEESESGDYKSYNDPTKTNSQNEIYCSSAPSTLSEKSFFKRSNAVRHKYSLNKSSSWINHRPSSKESLHNAILLDTESDDGSGKDTGVSIAYFVDSVNHSIGSTVSEFQTSSNFGDTPQFTSCRNPVNLSKNRYTDIPCIEESRVKLNRNDPSPGIITLTDYIHANWVDGYRQKNAFICTQGPLSSTVADFLHMVIQYRAPIIVMTTRPREQGRDKCYQYWPDKVGERQIINGSNDQCATFEVSSLKAKEFGENCPESGACNDCEEHWYRVTYLRIKNYKTGEEHRVNHFYFHSWPDQGIPLSSQGFLHFILLIRHTYQQEISKLDYESELDQPIPPPPIVVHCSAGIGRTGTYVVIEICLKSLVDCGRFNLHETMLKVRSQRFKCIQNSNQYTYCRNTIIDYARHVGLLENQCDNDLVENKEQEVKEEVQKDSCKAW